MKNVGQSAGHAWLRRGGIRAGMNRSKKIITILAFSGIALGGVAATATPAFAGSSGQQIDLCPMGHMRGGVAVIVGLDQRGHRVRSPVIHLKKDGVCSPLLNWWWGGKVSIIWKPPHGGAELKSYNIPWTWPYDLINCYSDGKEA